MAGRQAPPRRSPEYVWLITGTLTVMTVVFGVALAKLHPGWADRWPAALLALPSFVLLGMSSRIIQVRRHGFSLSLNEISLVLSFYFAPAVLVVAVSVVATLIKELRRHATTDKLCFNVARAGA